MSNEWRRSFWDDMQSFANLYKERFGIEFISANSGNNSVKQLQDIQSLISQKPDILIISPNESGPLTAVVNMCEEAKIPLMTIDRALDVAPGNGLYVSAIQIDGYRSGIAQGIALVEKMTEKYGSPKGSVAEIPGILGSSPSRLTSMGIRRVLKDYPDIKVVTVRPGEYDREISYKAAQDILTVNKKGTLDAILTSSDDATLAAIEAAKSAGRDELMGYFFSVDGTVGGIQAMLNGEMAEISEEPPYFGLITFEYAIHYLNGEEIPTIVPIPQRCYKIDTAEKKDQLKKMMDAAVAQKLQFVPSTEGGYDKYVINKEMLQKYYPKPYWDQPAEYVKEFEPYIEMK
jgi:ribose transport system substrate-binding protein